MTWGAEGVPSPGNPGVLDVRDAEHVRRRYHDRIAELGVSVASLNAGSVEKQQRHYAVHASAFPKGMPRLLDVGCGLAQFRGWLYERGIECAYTGYDIVPEYIDSDRKEFPAECFKVHNILTEGLDGVFDTIVISQVLNNRYQYSDNLTVMEQALGLAMEHATFSVSVDMLSTTVDFMEPHLYYYDPVKIIEVVKQITPWVRLRHDYHPHEFCIQLFRQPFLDGVYD